MRTCGHVNEGNGKLCGRQSGWGTSHKGVGRCRDHERKADHDWRVRLAQNEVHVWSREFRREVGHLTQGRNSRALKRFLHWALRDVPSEQVFNRFLRGWRVSIPESGLRWEKKTVRSKDGTGLHYIRLTQKSAHHTLYFKRPVPFAFFDALVAGCENPFQETEPDEPAGDGHEKARQGQLQSDAGGPQIPLGQPAPGDGQDAGQAQ